MITVTKAGLVVTVGDDTFELPWIGIRGISAGRAPATAEIWHLVLAIDVIANGRDHILIVTEQDPVWATLTRLLNQIFEQTPPIEVWGPIVLATTAPVSVYECPTLTNGARILH